MFLRISNSNDDIGIVFLHLKMGTNWVTFIKENCFDWYGCSPLKLLWKTCYEKKYGKCIFFWIQNSRKWLFFLAYSLYISYLTKVLNIDFKSAIIQLYCNKSWLEGILRLVIVENSLLWSKIIKSSNLSAFRNQSTRKTEIYHKTVSAKCFRPNI